MIFSDNVPVFIAKIYFFLPYFSVLKVYFLNIIHVI